MTSLMHRRQTEVSCRTLCDELTGMSAVRDARIGENVKAHLELDFATGNDTYGTLFLISYGLPKLIDEAILLLL